MAQKEFFISAAELVDVHGATNIPTVLLYRPKQGLLFGAEAVAEGNDHNNLNEDFKVDLGNHKPGLVGIQRFSTGDGKSRSAAELTADFFHELLTSISNWLSDREVEKSPNILVAEPLAMQGGFVSEGWLSNYRNYVRRILTGKGFENIDFLPEPFAVYQYYRHLEKHPIVAEQKKHQALVVDFGGGTFDVCLIETTKEGDIAKDGRLARPLGASSIPVGGFFINRVIAEELIRKLMGPRNIGNKVNRAFDLYRRYRRENVDIASLSSEYRNFIKNYHRLTYRVEDAKLTLCRLIRNWTVDAQLALSVPVAVPQDPFADTNEVANVQLSATELRSIFISKIWEPHLRNIVQLALQRGKEELSGAPVTVILLSGGSANIRWLAELLRRDFDVALHQAEILQLKDFQEVVAKGLAVECARRYYTEESGGDFQSVTYNRLCLILDPDDTGQELKKFIPKDKDLPSPEAQGVLLPSASVLNRFKGKSMRWRVHLDSAPRRCLNYYFLRSSFDPADLQNLQNVEERVIYPPKNTKFDPDLTIELTVAQDGTAIPTFIYRTGRTKEDMAAQQGRPFYLDMTTGESSRRADAYLGVDFGTSNTSVSFVNESAIQVYRRRSQEQFWNELSDLSSSLPYPLAAPLAHYMSQTDSSRLASAAREFLEAVLTLASYLSYQEYSSLKGRGETKLFKGFSKRSAGPLWKLLQESMREMGKGAVFSSAFSELLEPELFVEINKAVTLIAQHKHGKVTDEAANVLRPVRILANVSHRAFGDHAFGVFQHVEKQRFGSSYEGIFRHAHGRPPFVNISKYLGKNAFSNNETFVVNSETRSALPLEPLIVWESCSKHSDLANGHCYLFDSAEKDGNFSYKAVGYPCVLTAHAKNAYSGLAAQLNLRIQNDPKIEQTAVDLTR